MNITEVDCCTFQEVPSLHNDKRMQNSLLIVTGPTAVGKTEFVLKLAYLLQGEIINGDVGQLYTSLTIGTAKPSWKTEQVPHHIFDILGEPQDYTVMRYRSLVHTTIAAVWSRGHLPIVVGGSLFYLQSLLFPPPKLPTRASCALPVTDDHTKPLSWQKLQAIDPIRAQAIHPNDTYRIKRALELWSSTGKLPSTCTPSYAPLCRTHMLFLTRDRSELYERINERVIQMIQQGWLDEVAELQATPWAAFLQRKKIIGYPELLDYLAEPSVSPALDAIIAAIQQKTRHYAKQQESFARQLERRINEIPRKIASVLTTTQRLNLTSYKDDLYISHLADDIGSLLKNTH